MGVLLASTARAEPSKEDVAKADALFREAQGLVQKGQYSEGCEKFAESQQLDPANGTLLNLAICHEKEGKTATAYRELQELLAIMNGSKNPNDKERTKVANERLQVIEKKLSRVSFDASAIPKDASLALDSERVITDPAAPTIVDPGTHTVEITAAEKKPGKKTFEVRDPGTTWVKLDPLEDLAPPPPPEVPAPAPPPEPPKPASFWTGQRIFGTVLAGVGLASVGVGAYFGIDTFSKRDARDLRCRGTVCDAEGIRLHEAAGQSATISTIGVAAGAGALVVGAILVFTGAPTKTATPEAGALAKGRSSPPSWPQVSVGPTGALVHGSF